MDILHIVLTEKPAAEQPHQPRKEETGEYGNSRSRDAQEEGVGILLIMLEGGQKKHQCESGETDPADRDGKPGQDREEKADHTGA